MFNDETVKKSAQLDVWGFALVLQAGLLSWIPINPIKGSFDARTRTWPRFRSVGRAARLGLLQIRNFLFRHFVFKKLFRNEHQGSGKSKIDTNSSCSCFRTGARVCWFWSASRKMHSRRSKSTTEKHLWWSDIYWQLRCALFLLNNAIPFLAGTFVWCQHILLTWNVNRVSRVLTMFWIIMPLLMGPECNLWYLLAWGRELSTDRPRSRLSFIFIKIMLTTAFFGAFGTVFEIPKLLWSEKAKLWLTTRLKIFWIFFFIETSVCFKRWEYG